MKIKMLKDFNWGINYKSVSFKKNQICSIPDELSSDISKKMIDNFYAIPVESADENKEHEVVEKKDLVQENKAVEAAAENKAPAKRGRRKKDNKS